MNGHGQTYDFCLAWNWEYDADPVTLLESACRERGLSFLQATPDRIEEIARSLLQDRLSFRVFLDRASEADARYYALVAWARANALYRINPFERASRTWDKAEMHYALIHGGLQTPHTIIIPPGREQPAMPPADLSPLGEKFTIKPAHGSGGDGVILEATSWEQALAARQFNPADHFLLQAHVTPVLLGSRPAWFRVLYCTGRAYPCWWDTKTHAYVPVTPEEENAHRLGPLKQMAETIARICGLDSFSTEIALTAAGLFTVVDYINDQIDLRPQSKALDGVPDWIVKDVVERLADLAAAHCRRASSEPAPSPSPPSLPPSPPNKLPI